MIAYLSSVLGKWTKIKVIKCQFLESHIKGNISLLFSWVDLLILQLVALLALQCPSSVPCPTPPLLHYKITFTLFSVMTLHKGNQHPHTQTSHLKPSLQIPQGAGWTSSPKMRSHVRTVASGWVLLMLSSWCEWSFPLWWDRLEIAPHHCCQ